MEYISVIWKHNHRDEPVRLVSEIDGERFEVRKLEFFRMDPLASLARKPKALARGLGK